MEKAFDAESCLTSLGISYANSGRNIGTSWLGVKCPWCDDPSMHGGFHRQTGRYHCWRCGPHPIVDTLAMMLNDTARAKAAFREHSTKRVHRVTFARPPRKSKRAYSKRARGVALPGGALSARHREYLEGRGFDADKIIRDWHIRGTGPVGDYKHRIIIPVADANVPVTFTSRDITGKSNLRYKACHPNDELVKIKSLLYGEDYVRSESVVLVEGPFDVWRFPPGMAVCTFGTSVTAAQYLRLSKYDRVFLMFDPGASTVDSVVTTLESLGVEVVKIDLPSDVDPADLCQEDADLIVKELGL